MTLRATFAWPYSVAQQLRCPTLLIWAKDDYINPFLWTRRFRGHPNLTLHATPTGGHMVLAGPSKCRSPCHGMALKSQNELLTCVG